MQCNECNSPLKIISGGHKTTLESTDITMVHVFGCMNKNCKLAMKEQSRSENIIESFAEVEPEAPEVDVNINITTDAPQVEEVTEII